MTQVFLTSASTSPWSRPADWGAGLGHTVELVSCGGNGFSPATATNGGNGGGGGGYNKLTYSSGSLGSTTAFQIAASNSNTSYVVTSSTIWEGTTATNSYECKAGLAGLTGGSAASSGGSSVTNGTPSPVTYTTAANNGGNGGATVAGKSSGGGGGGAGGPSGVGAAGTSLTATATGGGGGGGSNGGSTTTTTGTTTGTAGGNGHGGTGGGAGGTSTSTATGTAGTAGTGGGGGGGFYSSTTGTINSTGGAGSDDHSYDSTHGPGAGGGGGGGQGSTATQTAAGGGGANYGGGAGGGGRWATGSGNGGTGGGGLIVITYTEGSVVLDAAGSHFSSSSLGNASGLTTTFLTVGTGLHNGALVALAVVKTASAITPTATWDSGTTNAAMTVIDHLVDATNGYHLVLYGLLNPKAGNLQLAINWGVSAAYDVSAISFQNVKQTSIQEAFQVTEVVNGSGTTTPSVVIPIESTSDAVVGLLFDATAGVSSVSDTNMFNNASSPFGAAQYAVPSPLLSGTSKTLTATLSSSTHHWSYQGMDVVWDGATGRYVPPNIRRLVYRRIY